MSDIGRRLAIGKLVASVAAVPVSCPPPPWAHRGVPTPMALTDDASQPAGTSTTSPIHHTRAAALIHLGRQTRERRYTGSTRHPI